jgi:arylsulfatase A-like enzyme
MAGEGTRFTQAYCGTTVCAPSRASLMTGLHSGHCPVRGNWEIKAEGQKPLPVETVTVAEVLKSTGVTGKWGMGFFDTTGSPLKQGFDRFYGYNCQRHAHSYFPTYLWDDDRRIELPGNAGGPQSSGKKTYSHSSKRKRSTSSALTKQSHSSSSTPSPCPTVTMKSTTSASMPTSHGAWRKNPTPPKSPVSTPMSAE